MNDFWNLKEENNIELKYTDKDGSTDKTEFNTYDGSDEDFNKLVKELTNYINTYKLQRNLHADYTIY